MFSPMKLQYRHLSPTPTLTKCAVTGESLASRRSFAAGLSRRKLLVTASLQSESNNYSSTTSKPHQLSSAIGFPSSAAALQWTVTKRHVTLLSFMAGAAAISATLLFCSAIPALMAFKKAAESLEKLMDVTREELPDTMAAVRLSGMEISDLTMELSDLGQGLTQGVRSSTRAVRLAEERLRRLTNTTPPASFQEVAQIETTTSSVPVLAKTARGIREGIVKSRALFQIIFTLTRYSRYAFNYIGSRSPSRAKA